jgi:copper homeostasis protein
MTQNNLLFEICIDSVEGAIAAQEGGGNRVELCANLLEGGTTPTAGTIELARKKIDADMNVMIRPRGGDFCYSSIEFDVMKLDIQIAKDLGANGVVIGLLTEDGAIDMARTRALVELARPLTVTFHRAFDMTRSPFQSLEDLISLGIDRVLTSGQEITVLEGLDLITALVKQAGDRIIVMPGGGITDRNIGKIVNQCHPKEIHIAGLVSVDGRMKYRNNRVFMGGEFRPPEFTLTVTDSNKIRDCRAAAQWSG